MNIENKLFELSKSEQKHRKQHDKSNAYYEHVGKIKVRGTEVYLFAYDNLLKKNTNILNLSSSNNKPAIILQKHVRYSYVPYHVHDYIELTYVLHGKLNETIEEKSFQLTEGSIAFLNTHTIHRIGKTDKQDLAVNILIRKEFLSDQIISIFPTQTPLAAFFLNCLSVENDRPDFFVIEKCQDIKPIVLEMLREQKENSSNKIEILDMLMKVFFLRVLRSQTYDIYNSKSSQINNIIDYITVNFRSITLDKCAKHFGFSPNYFSHLVHTKTGKTFKQLVLEKKLKYIDYMLVNSVLPIQEILDNVNISNSTYFYKKFRELHGCSPKEYRSNQ